MTPKYEVGQAVIVRPARGEHLSPRDSGLEPFAGSQGTIKDYYWISLTRGAVFYIYSVRIGGSRKELVLHEDELEYA